MSIRSFIAGEVIYHEGDLCSTAYIILSGEVDITSSGYVKTISAGEIFGELSLLQGVPHRVTAIARSDVSLQELSLNEIDKLLDDSPPAMQKIVRSLTRDLQFASATVSISTDANAELTSQFMLQLTDLHVIAPLLDDDSITDILINGVNGIYIERKGKLELSDIHFSNDKEVYEVAEKLVKAVGRRMDPTRPLVDARLLDGSRVNIIASPLAVDGTMISIRKFSKQKVTLDVMKKNENVSKSLGEFLKVVGRCRLNLVVSGGTGSGKTTLLNAISQHIDPAERIVTIEDAVELQLQQPHVIRLETKPMQLGMRNDEEVTIRDLVRNALRMRPDRIIVGEIRGAEAFDMMQAMNTGHDGSLTTLHANHPRDAIARLENMIGMSNMQIPQKSMRYQLASALHLIIQVSRMRDGKRRVTHITEVVGMEGDVVTMHDLFNYVVEGEDEEGNLKGQFKWSGIMPRFVRRVGYYGELERLENALGVKLPKNI